MSGWLHVDSLPYIAIGNGSFSKGNEPDLIGNDRVQKEENEEIRFRASSSGKEMMMWLPKLNLIHQ